MKRRLTGGIVTMAVLAGMVTTGGTAAQTTEAAAPTPLQTYYTAPATNWEKEAMPLGNGFIGAMVFGGVDSDRVQLNEHTLWSGGPGANASYNGGHKGTPAQAKAALRELRELLQQRANDFPQAYKNENGQIISQNYPPETDRMKTLINTLMGDKSGFGSYQTFGNLLIVDPASAPPVVVYATSNAEPRPGTTGQFASNLFDGSNGTKWYTGDAVSLNFPITVDWEYEAAFTTGGYTLVSGEDVPDRDPVTWKLYGSLDGTDYTLLNEQTGVTWSGRNQEKHFTFTQGTYKHFRLAISATAGSGGRTPPQLAQIRMDDAGYAPPVYDNYRRGLDLREAVASVSCRQDGVTYTREYFVSNPGNFLAVRLTADKPGSITKRFSLTTEHKNHVVSADADAGTVTLTGQPSGHGANGLHFAGQLKVVHEKGTIAAHGEALDVTGADAVTLIFSAGTDYFQCMDDTFDFFTHEDPLPEIVERVNAAAA
ncbi:MAG: glycoside hydrolase family 95 protein, partial [Oscillospiraceae bacterium]|nr:glycoside hydrolase family 95 protein [Oscillospiraceae bacterium]